MHKSARMKVARIFSTAAILASAIGLAHATPATWTGTVNGSTYNFSVITGALSSDEVKTVLSNQAWYQDADLAALFAAAVAGHLGTNYTQGAESNLGPLFYEGSTDNGDGTLSVNGSFYFGGLDNGTTVIDPGVFSALGLGPVEAGTAMNFAIATLAEVPEIDGKTLPMAAFLAVVLVFWLRSRQPRLLQGDAGLA